MEVFYQDHFLEGYEKISEQCPMTLSSPICVIIYGIIAYSLQLFLALMFRKIMRPRRFGKNRHSLRISQIIMYGLFPSASFMVLIVLLYISTGRNVSEAILAFTCGSSYVPAHFCEHPLVQPGDRCGDSSRRSRTRTAQYHPCNLHAGL